MTTSTMEAPITVVVRRRVRTAREADYEAWLEDLIGRAATLPDYLGSDIHRPTDTGPRQDTGVFRFDSLENLQTFERSDIRREALASVGEYVEADARWETLTGLEFCFSPPPLQRHLPPS